MKIHFFGSQFHSQQLIDLLGSKCDLFWFDRLRVGIDYTFRQLATRRLQDESCSALTGPIADSDIRSPLEPIGRFRAQAQSLRGGPDVLWLEIGAFDQHIDSVQI